MRVLRGLWLAAVLLLLAGCTSEQSLRTKPTDEGTALAAYASDGVRIARSDFCAEISDASVERALDGPSLNTGHYGSGGQVEVSPGVSDIGHEFNCTFEAADGSVARGWVFAPPVTGDQAAQLVRHSLKQPGCRPHAGAAPFGSPTVATTCVADGSTTLVFRGLFIEAWLSCSLTRPGTLTEELNDHAGRWCVAVAQAAQAQPTLRPLGARCLDASGCRLP